MQPQQPPMQKHSDDYAETKERLERKGPDSPRIMESLLIFLMYSVITDICRQCVCASGGKCGSKWIPKLALCAHRFTPVWSWCIMKLVVSRLRNPGKDPAFKSYILMQSVQHFSNSMLGQRIWPVSPGFACMKMWTSTKKENAPFGKQQLSPISKKTG